MASSASVDAVSISAVRRRVDVASQSPPWTPHTRGVQGRADSEATKAARRPVLGAFVSSGMHERRPRVIGSGIGCAIEVARRAASASCGALNATASPSAALRHLAASLAETRETGADAALRRGPRHANLTEETCAICLDNLKHPQRFWCGHRFCSACAEAWLHRSETCPICRRIAKPLRAAWRRWWPQIAWRLEICAFLLVYFQMLWLSFTTSGPLGWFFFGVA
eukprot:CAMPEP_0176104352 /NCGR_PEP_ID=MMETSP0120_2-20121206/52361_1 /TAXON_ID=160619 /ORGANISM="Kryptoperidinium foliaceum, Strain CCMP 1326" /LENGTH=223 /DNA_ID=CAMNT_0017438455 /DNA_START=61 /DNA_END=729 /DNA_ORIENTATION=-